MYSKRNNEGWTDVGTTAVTAFFSYPIQTRRKSIIVRWSNERRSTEKCLSSNVRGVDDTSQLTHKMFTREGSLESQTSVRPFVRLSLTMQAKGHTRQGFHSIANIRVIVGENSQ